MDAPMMCLINLSSNCEIVQEIWKKKFDVQRMVKKLFMVGTKKQSKKESIDIGIDSKAHSDVRKICCESTCACSSRRCVVKN